MPQRSAQCARSILKGIPPVMWFIRRHMREYRGQSLSVPQFRILALLDQQPRTQQVCVCEQLGCTAPTGSRLVTGLTDKGLVRRRPGRSDRREVALTLTPRGRRVLALSRRNTRRHLAARVQQLPDAELILIARAMRLLRGTFTVPAKARRQAAATCRDRAQPRMSPGREAVRRHSRNGRPARRRSALLAQKG
jgi:DNA-binding MarR family transcriptional regulator